MKKVVLAYSGGLDTSVAVAWLKEQFDTEIDGEPVSYTHLTLPTN